MRIALVIAAGLTMVLAAAHSYLGERYILTRLFRRDNLPKLLGGVEFTKQTLRFDWASCLPLRRSPRCWR
jgi:hypothetical protein